MKIFTLLLAAAGLATAADAITFTSSPATGLPLGDPGALASETWVLDYESGLNGVIASGNYHITDANASGVAAQPLGSPAGNHYFSVPQAGGSGVATLDFSNAFDGNNVQTFSFYWGSIDNFNKLEVLDVGGNALTFTDLGRDYILGSDIFNPANGSWTLADTNRRVYFSLGADESLGSLRFTSNGIAYEHDNVAVGMVPEPATWAMLIAGFGMVGFAMRRRQRMVSVSA